MFKKTQVVASAEFLIAWLAVRSQNKMIMLKNQALAALAAVVLTAARAAASGPSGGKELLELLELALDIFITTGPKAFT